MNSIIKLSDVFAELVFSMFYTHIMKDGGDGSGVICCSNPEETSEVFLYWWRKNILPSLKKNLKDKHNMDIDDEFYPKIVYNGIINFNKCNENFMFTDRILPLSYGDICYIIEKDCPMGFEKKCDINHNFKIGAICADVNKS